MACWLVLLHLVLLHLVLLLTSPCLTQEGRKVHINCGAACIEAFAEFATRHIDSPLQSLPKPIDSADMRKLGVPEADVKQVEAWGKEELFQMIMGADILDCEQFVDLLATALACRLVSCG